jgi:hypothetical protein
VVDDSEILEPGDCKLEAWATRGGTGDHLGAVIAEAFGLDSGRWGKQIGLRPTLIEDLLDLDLVYGRDIDGSRSNWFSLGGILKF